MSAKHTPVLWAVDNTDSLLFVKKQGKGAEPVGFVFGPSFPEKSEVGMRAIANTRRIVACINACDGVSTENLEENKPVVWLAEEYNNVVKQRNDLMEVLQEILADGIHCDVVPHLHRRAAEAIAKATGESK